MVQRRPLQKLSRARADFANPCQFRLTIVSTAYAVQALSQRFSYGSCHALTGCVGKLPSKLVGFSAFYIQAWSGAILPAATTSKTSASCTQQYG
jgi:hypothetical protein